MARQEVVRKEKGQEAALRGQERREEERERQDEAEEEDPLEYVENVHFVDDIFGAQNVIFNDGVPVAQMM